MTTPRARASSMRDTRAHPLAWERISSKIKHNAASSPMATRNTNNAHALAKYIPPVSRSNTLAVSSAADPEPRKRRTAEGDAMATYHPPQPASTTMRVKQYVDTALPLPATRRADNTHALTEYTAPKDLPHFQLNKETLLKNTHALTEYKTAALPTETPQVTTYKVKAPARHLTPPSSRSQTRPDSHAHAHASSHALAEFKSVAVADTPTPTRAQTTRTPHALAPYRSPSRSAGRRTASNSHAIAVHRADTPPREHRVVEEDSPASDRTSPSTTTRVKKYMDPALPLPAPNYSSSVRSLTQYKTPASASKKLIKATSPARPRELAESSAALPRSDKQHSVNNLNELAKYSATGHASTTGKRHDVDNQHALTEYLAPRDPPQFQTNTETLLKDTHALVPHPSAARPAEATRGTIHSVKAPVRHLASPPTTSRTSPNAHALAKYTGRVPPRDVHANARTEPSHALAKALPFVPPFPSVPVSGRSAPPLALPDGRTFWQRLRSRWEIDETVNRGGAALQALTADARHFVESNLLILSVAWTVAGTLAIVLYLWDLQRNKRKNGIKASKDTLAQLDVALRQPGLSLEEERGLKLLSGMAREEVAPAGALSLTVTELQKLCANKRLPVSGTRDDLIQRLSRSIEQDIVARESARHAARAKSGTGERSATNPWNRFCSQKWAEMRRQGKRITVQDLSRLYREEPREFGAHV